MAVPAVMAVKEVAAVCSHLYAAELTEWVTAEMLNWGHLPLLPTSAGVRFSQNMLPILEPMPYG